VYSIAFWTKKERLGETELTRAFDLNLQRRHKKFLYTFSILVLVGDIFVKKLIQKTLT
jgi:hypothetical protein